MSMDVMFVCLRGSELSGSIAAFRPSTILIGAGEPNRKEDPLGELQRAVRDCIADEKMWAARARHRVDFRGKLAFGDRRQHGIAARATITHLLRRDRNRLDGVVRQVNRLDNEAGTEARLPGQMIERVIKLVV